jgi:hypothetical protein
MSRRYDIRTMVVNIGKRRTMDRLPLKVTSTDNRRYRVDAGHTARLATTLVPKLTRLPKTTASNRH